MAHNSGKFNVNSAWEILRNASNRKNSSSFGKKEFLLKSLFSYGGYGKRSSQLGNF